MKKLLIILGGVVALFVLAAVLVPLFVDVDQYRPRIESAVNQRINGKLELGRLNLSLWGRIRVKIEGLKLTGPGKAEILSVKDAYFHLPFLPILSGSPVVTLRMTEPSVRIISNRQGDLNVMKLMKKDVAAAADAPSDEPADDSGKQTPSGTGDLAIPGIVASARLGMELRNADIVYQDQATDLSTRFEKVNFLVRDLSLSRPAEIELWGDLNTTLGKEMKVAGPALLKARAEPTLQDGRLARLAGSIEARMDDLEIVYGNLFHKKKGIPANVNGSFSTTFEEASLDSLQANFHNVVLMAKAKVKNLQSPTVSFEMKSNDIELRPWADLIPMLKEYELGGKARLEAQANGPADKLDYSGRLVIDALTAKSPQLKTQPRIDARVNLATDRIENFLVTMKAPGNDLKMEGKLISFTKPSLQASITSGGMDLDQLVVLPPLGEDAPASGGAPAAAGTGAGSGTAAGSGGATPADEDYDAMVQPLGENPVMAAMSGIVDIRMAHLQVYGVRMSDIQAKKSIRNLVATIDPFGMKVFDGVVKATASVDLKPAKPSYRFNAELAGIELQKVVESQFQLLKNTILGKVNARIDGQGSSFNPEPAKANLNAKGAFRATDATFATIDVGRMAAEAVQNGLAKAAQKVPALKGREIKTPSNRESKYEFISSDFTIQGGKFSSPNFQAKAYPNRGLDLNGRTTVGMIDYKLDARWEIVDTYNLLKARDLSANIAGTRIDHLLAEGNGPVKFPVSVGCTVMAPCYQYGEVAEHFAKVAANNVSRGATGRAKQEVRKKLEEQIIKSAPPKAQEKLKGIGKKLFGR